MEAARSQNESSQTKYNSLGRRRKVILIGTIVIMLLVISLSVFVYDKYFREKDSNVINATAPNIKCASPTQYPTHNPSSGPTTNLSQILSQVDLGISNRIPKPSPVPTETLNQPLTQSRKPTALPTRNPTESPIQSSNQPLALSRKPTALPTRNPTESPTQSLNCEEIQLDLGLLACPPPGDPLTLHQGDNTNAVDQYRIVLPNSPEGILCTLLEVSADETQTADGNLRLKPIGRSYNGNGWEPYQGLHSSFNAIPLECSNNDVQSCTIVLPAPQTGRKYILKSYEHSLGPRDEAARFLEKITFGPTSSEIDTFVASGTNPSNWLQQQLELPIISSHREFFRKRANNFHPETTWMGTLSFKPCEAGARYRRFVFVPKDKDQKLTIATSPVDANYKLLMVGGEIRSVIPGQVQVHVSENDLPVVPDGR